MEGCEGEAVGQGRAWDDDLSEGHIVVRHKDQLQEVADVRVVVDLGADRADQLDDALGHLISGGCLAANHTHAWHHLRWLSCLSPHPVHATPGSQDGKYAEFYCRS